ncbi:HhH-GPD family protein [Haloferax massiliensis]|uniref:A/G-specific adenine glycosylase n=1 Tax=Haloferax massiliensis TaxID=1476858 RepID=A0A0D6JPU8_9EURY|nr:A/G-specific adenine glycosylase [Haloferax massiliensis]CQR49653.1 A/G-specific adenine glycosylase [Haloferax massiliensis]
MLNPQQSFVGPLLAWHEENGRHRLPWREPGRSAFEILIAEILLQRTTAASVSGAYLPIVARYPSPETVVAANPEAIERRIAPLGLAKRAEFIRRTSQQLVARHSGDVSRRYADLLELHGVGAYTARSVLTHAFDEDIAAVDTNVRRLISRFFDLPPDSGTLPHLADGLVPSRRGSDFQHAMLDFAADVCTARTPQCETCPFGEHCRSSERAV